VSVFGTVELGGTKTDMAFGTSPDDLSPPFRVATTTPEETLRAVVEYFASHAVDAVGVASFGPLDLNPKSRRFGTMLSTPKPGWSDHPVLEALRTAMKVPLSIDTDVNGAALGEGRWGATQGMANFAYVTVGTGIGAGVVVNGKSITSPRHPETGHMRVQRQEGDRSKLASAAPTPGPVTTRSWTRRPTTSPRGWSLSCTWPVRRESWSAGACPDSPGSTLDFARRWKRSSRTTRSHPTWICSYPLPVWGIYLDWRAAWSSPERRPPDVDAEASDPPGQP
jgi:hypothetical protein